ncbi:MAG: hypothetical protein FVQ80_08810 [Planctomycetes bacterium]|nr:hypothetical protein [Planctomycetota bacterium]
MEQELKNLNGLVNELFNRLAAEKKKAVMVVCLFVVMIFMWARAFAGKGPAAAQALTSSAKVEKKLMAGLQEISFIDLPVIKGRNDLITNDFFSADKQEKNSEVNIKSTTANEAQISWIKENLKLEAIGLGKISHAFINGRVFSVGDQIILKDGNDSYTCKVIGIEQEKVLIKYGQKQIKLKFNERIDVTY